MEANARIEPGIQLMCVGLCGCARVTTVNSYGWVDGAASLSVAVCVSTSGGVIGARELKYQAPTTTIASTTTMMGKRFMRLLLRKATLYDPIGFQPGRFSW